MHSHLASQTKDPSNIISLGKLVSGSTFSFQETNCWIIREQSVSPRFCSRGQDIPPNMHFLRILPAIGLTLNNLVICSSRFDIVLGWLQLEFPVWSEKLFDNKRLPLWARSVRTTMDISLLLRSDCKWATRGNEQWGHYSGVHSRLQQLPDGLRVRRAKLQLMLISVFSSRPGCLLIALFTFRLCIFGVFQSGGEFTRCADRPRWEAIARGKILIKYYYLIIHDRQRHDIALESSSNSRDPWTATDADLISRNGQEFLCLFGARGNSCDN